MGTSMPPPPTTDPTTAPVTGAGSGSGFDKFRSIISRVTGGGTPMIDKQLEDAHQKRVAEAELHKKNSQDLGQILTRGVDPQTGEKLHNPDGSLTPAGQKYETQRQAAWAAYSKVAGVNKESKSIIQKMGQVADHLVHHRKGMPAPPDAQGGGATPPAASSASASPSGMPAPPASASAAPGGMPAPPGDPATLNEMSQAAAKNANSLDLYTKEGQADEEAKGPKALYDNLKKIPGITDDEAKKIVAEKFAGAAARQKHHAVTYADPNDPAKKLFGTQDLTTGQVFDQEGNVVENAGQVVSAMLPSQSTSSVTYDPNTGTTTTSRKTSKLPAPGGSVTKPKTSAGSKLPATPHEGRVATLADAWASSGIEPQAKDKAAVEAYMKDNGLEPGYKPTGASRSRADAAVAVAPLVKEVQTMLADPEIRAKLGVLPGRVSEVEKRIGDLDPKVARLYGTLKSIYSLAGAMHGWRSIKVAEEFEKAYGGLHTNPDTLLASLDAMTDTANVVYQAGYNRKMPAPPAGGGMSADEEARKYLEGK